MRVCQLAERRAAGLPLAQSRKHLPATTGRMVAWHTAIQCIDRCATNSGDYSVAQVSAKPAQD